MSSCSGIPLVKMGIRLAYRGTAMPSIDLILFLSITSRGEPPDFSSHFSKSAILTS
jgi:hypothetical protein